MNRHRRLYGILFVCLLLLTAFGPTDAPQAQSGAVERHPSPVLWWQPAPGTTWQWQLSDLPIDTGYDVDMYDVDLFENDAALVAELHAAGRIAIAYLSAGTWENWRPDAGDFPPEVIGRRLGWPGERWLDIRRIDLLGPIMEARLELAVAKGFDGVEPDNVDGYANLTGFPLTYDDQIAYNTWFADQAHARGLSVGLKNDLAQVVDLEPYFDWALNEQCFQYRECFSPDGGLLPFILAGKAVFQVEYGLPRWLFCGRANAVHFSSMRKRPALDAWAAPCW